MKRFFLKKGSVTRKIIKVIVKNKLFNFMMRDILEIIKDDKPQNIKTNFYNLRSRDFFIFLSPSHYALNPDFDTSEIEKELEEEKKDLCR